MPKYSKRSKNKLSTCDEKLQALLNEVIKNYDCTILEGHRTVERQLELYNQGKSKIDGINKLGKHNYSPSKGIDVAPYPVDWNDTKRFYHFAGYVKGVADTLGINIRCGADWDGDNDFSDQTFNDLVHFEVV